MRWHDCDCGAGVARVKLKGEQGCFLSNPDHLLSHTLIMRRKSRPLWLHSIPRPSRALYLQPPAASWASASSDCPLNEFQHDAMGKSGTPHLRRT